MRGHIAATTGSPEPHHRNRCRQIEFMWQGAPGSPEASAGPLVHNRRGRINATILAKEWKSTPLNHQGDQHQLFEQNMLHQVVGLCPAKICRRLLFCPIFVPYRRVVFAGGAMAFKCVLCKNPTTKPIWLRAPTEGCQVLRRQACKKASNLWEIDRQTGRTNHQTTSPLGKDPPTGKRREPEEQACLMDRRTDRRTDRQTDDNTQKRKADKTGIILFLSYPLRALGRT